MPLNAAFNGHQHIKNYHSFGMCCIHQHPVSSRYNFEFLLHYVRLFYSNNGDENGKINSKILYILYYIF